MSFMSCTYHFLQFSSQMLQVTRIGAIFTLSSSKKVCPNSWWMSFPFGHLVEKEADCFIAPGLKASKKPLNGVYEWKFPPQKPPRWLKLELLSGGTGLASLTTAVDLAILPLRQLEAAARAEISCHWRKWPPGWENCGCEGLCLTTRPGTPGGVGCVSFETSWSHPVSLLSFTIKQVEAVGQRAELELEPKHPLARLVIVSFPKVRMCFLAFFIICTDPRLITIEFSILNPIHNVEG